MSARAAAAGLACLGVAALAGCAAKPAVPASPPSARAWQLERLFHPSSADLKAEARGRVMIYDGLTDRDVARAMQEQFDRVHAMMFTRTLVTDRDGEPRTDSSSGKPVREDDGC